jgi:O-antigen ligase
VTTKLIKQSPAGIALLGAFAAAGVVGFLAAANPPLGGKVIGGLTGMAILVLVAARSSASRTDVLGHVKLPVISVVAIVEVAAGDLIGSIHVGGFGTGDLSVYLTVGLAALIAILLPLELGPHRPTDVLRRVPLQLFLFLAWTIAITVAYGVNSAAIQNISCYFILIGGMVLTASTYRLGTEQKVLDVLVVVGWARAALYGFALATHGFGAASATGARSFAIIALILMAATIPSSRASLWTRVLPYVLWVEIVASGSRAAMGAGALLLLFLTVRNPRGGKVLRAGGALVVLLLGSWYAVGHVRPLHDRFFAGDNLGRNSVGLNTEGRLSIWPPVIQVAEIHPWTGSGGGTATNTVRSDPLIASAGEPHNDYLRLWADYGFLGLGLWLTGLVILLGRLWRRAAARRGNAATIHYAAFLAVAALSIMALTDNVLIYHFAVAPLAALVGLSLAQSLPARAWRP